MGTRSRIAAKQADGTFKSIYVHWDGYPEGVGVTLRDHYTTDEKVAQLIALGNLSSLDIEIGEKHDFGTSVDGQCTAYGRDRGETGQEAKDSPSLAHLCGLTQETGGEYLYVWADGKWQVAEGGVAFFGMPADKAPGTLLDIDVVLAAEAANED